ncbi:DUF420 domain-containing protein [Staphylococcus felis]|uniref:DUF420 domain-containing protein n=2 Tax=Staphylococcus felis TaxID=46127 RepID=A0A2K3Z9Y9_9STAP|nr:DUF420 domain-containing protein [Staphylococcus felis]AVP36787.1 DUF420 domain-containing protein [Staphylococcus felis]MBH9581709.1 DUF420 domain-containing protein [Staphylococcus felis]MDM8328343.1 DUF420 domain-containing protein [Staphylococcus felis]MDQ7192215.1 DUF420 domain-containing protein [Staphylococcus felis]PNZ34666.1 DUF420 domain-containing protein [Staphylococcus felis]
MDLMRILPMISTACISISAIFVAIGWRHIYMRRIEKHKKNMLTAATLAVIFFIIYASRTLLLGNTAFGGPDSLKPFYTIFLIFHIVLATVGAVMGIIQITTALKEKYHIHRKVGPTASVVWFCTAITGLVTNILLYVLYPGGETTSLLRATFGY